MEKEKNKGEVSVGIRVAMAVGIVLTCFFLGIIPGIILAIICYFIFRYIKKKNAQEQKRVIAGEETENG